jgi:hypothetical protein
MRNRILIGAMILVMAGVLIGGVTATTAAQHDRCRFSHSGRLNSLPELKAYVTCREGRQDAESPFSSPPSPTPWPSTPLRVCGEDKLLNGPDAAPVGAVEVPAGDNSNMELGLDRTTYWFAPGVHTLGNGEFAQIEPGEESVFIGGPGAIVDGKGKNRYAFTGRSQGVTIKYLTIQNFVAPMNEGTVNHDSGADWTMTNLTVSNNGGAGIFLGSGAEARYNCLKDNSQYGFQAYTSKGGDGGMVLESNEITGNNTSDWETKQPGCGCTGGGKFWDVRDVRVAHNYVHNNKSVGLWADTNNNNFVFESNWISDNAAQGIFWETSYNVAIRNNVLEHNLTKVGPDRIARHDNFPDAAIYISESGGDSRLEHDLVGSATVDIVGNLVKDNYNGITLWENADRFCGSPANTSSDYCTLVDPEKVSLSTCTDKNIAEPPYLSDCRWKTQNVNVHGNTFTIDRANFFDCPETMCGYNSILSNWGTYPDWSPYHEDVIEKAVTFDQGNRFSGNTYVGSWRFVALESGRNVTREEWMADPFEQDDGSMFRK